MDDLSKNQDSHREALGGEDNKGFGKRTGGDNYSYGGLWRGVRMSAGSADAIVFSLSALLFAFILSAILLATR